MAIAEAPVRTRRTAPYPPPTAKREPPAVPDRATDYARVVVAGEIVTGKFVRLACERHLRDLEHGQERGLRWDPAQAERTIRFFLFLSHFAGPKAGKPVVLEAWQCFIEGSIDGWQRFDPETGEWVRRFRRSFSEVGKKNGKSLTAGGRGLKEAFFSHEEGAEVYSAATKKDQARLVWGAAKKMADRSPDIRSRIISGATALSDRLTNSTFQFLGKDSKTEDGINPSAVIIDEVHRHEDRTLINLLSQSFGARVNPLLYMITTAGAIGESIWAEEHDYAERVLEGLVEDDALFAYIAMLDDGDDPFDESNWIKANPNIGVSVRWDDMRQQAREAKEKPGALNDFLRLRLNKRTSSRQTWVAAEVWAASGAAPAEAGGRLAYGGLDLGSRSDLAAFVVIAEDTDAHDEVVLDVFARFWCPRDGIEARSLKDRVPYDQWAREGWITATEGNVTDYDVIRADIAAVVDPGADWPGYDGTIEFDLWEVGYDPHDATQLSTQLTADGLRLVKIMQSSIELNAPIVETERFLAGVRLRHGNNPVLAWMVSNTVMVEDAGHRRRPDKEKAREKIDGVPALLMATKRWMANAGSEIEWGPA